MTLVILSYNHPELTDRCVRSALAFCKASSLILVHNGSEKKWVTQHQNNFPDIEHLILDTNRGYSGGANAGLAHGFERSSWVLFLTNDCQLLNEPSPPDQIGFFAPLIWARKVGRVDSLGGALTLFNGHLRHLKNYPEDFREHSELFYIPGTAFWMHKQIFADSKGFDETLGTYWEDVDLSLRAKKLGIFLGAHAQTKVLHGIGKTCHSNSFYTTYLFQRNRKRVCLAHAKNKFERSLIRFFLSLSWIRLAFKKVQKRQWEGLATLARAIRDQ